MTAEAAPALLPEGIIRRFAKWAGECQAPECAAESRAIEAGALINYGGNRGGITHAACPPVTQPLGGPRPARTPRRTSRRTRYAYTSTGARMTNRYGRCEDAPCCGCCD